jgi:hypothetical protein
MRVAEHGLRALARERRIKIKNRPIEWATWQDIIKELKKAHEAIGQGRAGPKKDADLAFYSGVIADLDAFKDEFWRDNQDETGATIRMRLAPGVG